MSIAIQQKINALHGKQLDETRKLALECGVKKNPIFAERTKAIAERGGSDFWTRVLKGHSDFAQELMGPYDAKILTSLTGFNVEHKPNGVRVTMKFGPNDYFSDSELWYEEEEAPGKQTVPTVSGVRWREGKGPVDEVQEAIKEQLAEAQQQQGGAGDRRARASDKKASDEHGPSFLTFFEALPPMPVREKNGNCDAADGGDFEDDEEGDDAFETAMDDWEETIDERREIARCLIEEIWEDPAAYIKQ